MSHAELLAEAKTLVDLLKLDDRFGYSKAIAAWLDLRDSDRDRELAQAKKELALAIKDAYGGTAYHNYQWDRAAKAEAQVKTMLSGGCICVQSESIGEEAHSMHCPKIATMMHEGYCKRIKELKKENDEWKKAFGVEALSEALTKFKQVLSVDPGSKPKPCLDPEKMKGYEDQFGGTDFPDVTL